MSVILPPHGQGMHIRKSSTMFSELKQNIWRKLFYFSIFILITSLLNDLIKYSIIVCYVFCIFFLNCTHFLVSPVLLFYWKKLKVFFICTVVQVLHRFLVNSLSFYWISKFCDSRISGWNGHPSVHKKIFKQNLLLFGNFSFASGFVCIALCAVLRETHTTLSCVSLSSLLALASGQTLLGKFIDGRSDLMEM